MLIKCSRIVWLVLLASALLFLAPNGRGQAPDPTDEAVPEELSKADWTCIRAAYEAGRHAAFTVEGGYQARNPGQHWTTLFDGRGFRVTPDAGDWTWGLELGAYGWGGDDWGVSMPRCVTSEGQRIEYVWDDRLTEWYVNNQRGLEHGFTLLARPDDAQGTLALELTIRGGLEAVLEANGRDLRFVGEGGGAALNYSGLAVFDADGRALEASFERVDAGLRLHVDDSGARYPLTIDPIAQQAYLKASNTDALDAFGSTVSVSGDTALVGAPGEASSATGVDGNQGDNSAGGAGAAYVFVRSGTTWIQQAYLKASNTDTGDHFGYSVSVSGDTVVVGAEWEDSGATGVNGDEGDNSATSAGAAYVFVRSGTNWSQQAYLKASNTEVSDAFGRSVSVSGDTAIVGALEEDSSATGVNGNQGDNSASRAGAAYVFVRSGTSWSQQAYLKASNTDPFDSFGGAVSVSGDTALVGALREDSSSTGVNGIQGGNSATYAGAAYVFVRSGTSWSQEAYLKASNTDAGDFFGEYVSVSGDTALVGARSEDSSATGVNGNQGDNSATDSGAAYVFVRSGTSWSQQAYLKASNTEASENFGYSVSVAGETIVVGALFEDSSATGVNGNQGDNSASASGAAYLFARSGTSWSQEAYLKASNTNEGDYFGYSVSVSGDTVIVGASRESSSATGVNGNQGDNSAERAGAAYVFLTGDIGTAFCFGDGTGAPCPCSAYGGLNEGCANSAGIGATLVGSGAASISSDTFTLSVAGVPGSKPGLLLRGDIQVAIPAGDGILCVSGGSLRSQVQVTDAGGTTIFTEFNVGGSGSGAPLGSVATAGVEVNYQFWYRDPANLCGGGFNFTHAVAVTYVP